MTTHNPNECPVCNEVDPDGLEACADCYNGVIAELARVKAENQRLRLALETLRRMREAS